MKGYSAYSARSLAPSPREEEAMAFRLTARTLKEASSKADRNNALNINHRVWSGVYREVTSPICALPEVLRNDLLRLAVFSLNYSTKAVLNDLPLAPLVQVNTDVADGLERPEQPDSAVSFPAMSGGAAKPAHALA
ncbi:flagellar biosynthesis regulator FlaF [Acetobacteraceae bacterium KSS8]|uniref:Flagellar biosynthesis regulator FlaF n=1 Tax=Endosaccharibacter trunci TaxID=2812733 RepID=A0ABT1W6I5_9PROT|nr:flagellar biosynthesis regulator FlaF [Acetobacteraceae bacterium KSS8]